MDSTNPSTHFKDNYNDSYKKILAQFYEANQQRLQRNYPGLSFHTLKSSLEDFFFSEIFITKGLLNSYGNIAYHEKFRHFIEMVDSGMPLAYIVQKAHFYGLDFWVNSSTLIPRPETEGLVELCLQKLKSKSNKSGPIHFAEVGVGTGCISLALLANSEDPLIGVGTDLSEQCIEVASVNKFRLNHFFHKSSEMKFQKNDRLTGLPSQSFDLVVSNPPYIKKNADKELVHSNVYDYEPHLALFLEDEFYFEWFGEFLRQTYDCLMPEGFFAFELSENYMPRLLDLANQTNFKETKIVSDLTGRPRYLTGIKN